MSSPSFSFFKAPAPSCSYLLLEDHTTDGKRDGEGSIVELRDGRLLMMYTSFEKGGDADPAKIVTRISSNKGLTWSESALHFSPPEEALNVMSVSLLRLQDGRIGCVFLIKWSQERLIPIFSYSEDEGISWSKPLPITHQEGYFVVNNDRLCQLRDGTLALPYAEHPKKDSSRDPNARCGLFLSKDGGATWQRSPYHTTFTPECFVPPLFQSPVQDQGDLADHIKTRQGVFQEPGVQELSDGSLMLYMRSAFYIYRCFAEHIEAPWGPCTPIPDFNVCCGPQTIRRLPSSTDLIMLYNDRGTLPWGDPEFNWRTPLSVALSHDDGKTWIRRGELEDSSKNYCYTSLLFFEERFIVSYYQSGVSTTPGKNPRRNLASLKICTGETKIFTLEK